MQENKLSQIARCRIWYSVWVIDLREGRMELFNVVERCESAKNFAVCLVGAQFFVLFYIPPQATLSRRSLLYMTDSPVSHGFCDVSVAFHVCNIVIVSSLNFTIIQGVDASSGK